MIRSLSPAQRVAELEAEVEHLRSLCYRVQEFQLEHTIHHYPICSMYDGDPLSCSCGVRELEKELAAVPLPVEVT